MLLKYDNSISKQMQLIKGESSFWINKYNIAVGEFEWADKYFGASVSDDKIEFVRAYINNQQEHHRRVSFADEYKIFLESLGYTEHFG